MTDDDDVHKNMTDKVTDDRFLLNSLRFPRFSTEIPEILEHGPSQPLVLKKDRL